MASFEKQHPPRQAESSSETRDERREYHFRALVQSHLLNTIQHALEDAEFLEPDIDAFMTALAELPEDDQQAVLTLPFEIRERLLRRYHEKVVGQQLSPAGVVNDLLEKNRRYGYTLGYHLSQKKVPQETHGTDVVWDIKGNEMDDRDDMHMAYYSEDYLNRYIKKNGRYLYIVRAETGADSPHKQDLKNHWGRAPFLSVIDELDMQAVEQDIDQAIEKE